MAHSKVNGLDQIIVVIFPRLQIVHGPFGCHEVWSASSNHHGSIFVHAKDGGIGGRVDDKIGLVARLGRQVEAGVHFSTHREKATIGSFKVEVIRTYEVEIAGQQIHGGRGLEAERGFEDVVLRSTLGLSVRSGVR